MAKLFHRTVFLILLLLLIVGVIATVLLRYGISPNQPQKILKPKSAAADLVDQQPLITAQRLATLATTAEEKEIAQNALRLADHEVDMAFAAALHNATRHPAPVPAAARPIQARVQKLQERVQAEQAALANLKLKQTAAKADDAHKESQDAELQLQEATLEADQEDLELAHQELIRAGGDPLSRIQELLEQHESVSHATTTAPNPGQNQPAAQNPESRIFMVQWRAWRQQADKEKELNSARAELATRETELTRERQALDNETKADETKAEVTKNEKPEENSAQQQSAEHSAPPAASPANTPLPSSAPDISSLKQAAGERRHLAEIDKRSSDLRQIDGLYAQWAAIVDEDRREHQAGLLEGVAWIVVLLLLVVFADRLVRMMVARLAPDSRRRHTVHMVSRFVVQAGGVALILLVLFGPPSQLGTVLALTGAGLTVALKDFIVGFFGWFILMGPNGIHPGDWVEINGIGGEVVSVGLLHTVILETGNWSDAGHPTGRKVTFVNSFAIEGHYFNFTTTGQWLWDELEVPITAGADPYPIAEAVHKAVIEATEADIRQADQEWRRVVPSHVGQTFSPVPAVTVRPTTLGISVLVRYITRANQRHEVRTRLFEKVVDLLRPGQAASPVASRPVTSAG